MHPIAWPGPSAATDSFELTAQEGGCRLVFTHVFDDRRLAAQTAAGWEAICRGSSLILPAGTYPKSRRTSRGRKFTNGTPSGSGSTPNRAVASWRLSVPVRIPHDLIVGSPPLGRKVRMELVGFVRGRRTDDTRRLRQVRVGRCFRTRPVRRHRPRRNATACLGGGGRGDAAVAERRPALLLASGSTSTSADRSEGGGEIRPLPVSGAVVGSGAEGCADPRRQRRGRLVPADHSCHGDELPHCPLQGPAGPHLVGGKGRAGTRPRCPCDRGLDVPRDRAHAGRRRAASPTCTSS